MAEEEFEQQEGEDTNNEQLEIEAREMGWVPQDEWNGNPDEWRDAQEFVERGKNILPIVRAHNKQLRQDLLTSNKELATLKETLKNTQRAVEALRKNYDADTKRQVEQARQELKQQIRQAREIGDVDTEFDLQDKLDELRQSESQSQEDHGVDNPTPSQQEIPPEVTSWQAEHSWFGDQSTLENVQRTQSMIWVMNQMRQRGDTTTGTKFLDNALTELERMEGKSPTRRTSKVEPGRNSGAQTGRKFLTLSQEAKNICHADTERFVGPGKMFKTEKEWEDHFASMIGDE